MERLSAGADGFETHDAHGSEAAQGSTYGADGTAANEDALDELEELGLFLADERRLEKEEMRRRSRRAKWTESKRRQRREV
jgi:hypothetical protein